MIEKTRPSSHLFLESPKVSQVSGKTIDWYADEPQDGCLELEELVRRFEVKIMSGRSIETAGGGFNVFFERGTVPLEDHYRWLLFSMIFCV